MVLDLFRLDGRVALVTGGAGPLGRTIGETLGELGASVVVTDLDPDACRARAGELAARTGAETLAIAADLRQPQAAAPVVDATLDRFQRIDIVVNNAAFTGASGLPGYAVPFAEQTAEAWHAAITVNLTAAFELCQRAHTALAASGHGVIINIGSIYGVVGPNMALYANTVMGNPAAYGASKGGILQLTRYLATVLAPRVRVNAVSPGGIERGQAASFVERYSRLTPLGRMGREEDVRGAIAYLASDASAYVTGQNLLVDGGWTAW